MPEYLVTWEIDSDAPNPSAAARRAWAAMRREGSIANVFTVRDKRTGETTTVDLDHDPVMVGRALARAARRDRRRRSILNRLGIADESSEA